MVYHHAIVLHNLAVFVLWQVICQFQNGIHPIGRAFGLCLIIGFLYLSGTRKTIKAISAFIRGLESQFRMTSKKHPISCTKVSSFFCYKSPISLRWSKKSIRGFCKKKKHTFDFHLSNSPVVPCLASSAKTVLGAGLFLSDICKNGFSANQKWSMKKIES